MKKRLPLLLLSLLAAGCLQNDLPLPYVVASITALEAEGAVSVTCDEDLRRVVIDLEETQNPAQVRITACTFNDERVVPSVPLIGEFDLRTPLSVVLKTYQEFAWTVCATQQIQREASVLGQVGAAVIDAVNHRVYIKVSKSVPLTWICVQSLKLGPAGQTRYSVNPAELRDFSAPVRLTVEYRDIREEWMILIEQSDLAVEFGQASPRTTSCYLSALAPEGAENGFRYRLQGESEWQDVPDVHSAGGLVTACVEGLAAQTAYECVAFSGEDETEVVAFTTDADEQLPNAGFECYSHAESANYYSWFDPASAEERLQAKWWDSGNVGSTSVGASYAICMPDTQDFQEGTASAALVSRNVLIKFAAGNIFSGEFASLVGTEGGIVHFGQPFTCRPRAMRLWLKYTPGLIDCISGYPDGQPVQTGDGDTGTIFIALGDWNYRDYGGTPAHPVAVNTADMRTKFNPDAPAVIAYGEMVLDADTAGWTQVEIPLSYRDDFRRPTHIIVSCAASSLGDYFTGSSSSRMWLDDIQLVY
ncbi:MAG: PCMD domain-containing protein [Bacteroidales bacterium]|nr:PCMD domain-containing protein [Bacteroidales bacterium]